MDITDELDNKRNRREHLGERARELRDRLDRMEGHYFEGGSLDTEYNILEDPFLDNNVDEDAVIFEEPVTGGMLKFLGGDPEDPENWEYIE